MHHGLGISSEISLHVVSLLNLLGQTALSSAHPATAVLSYDFLLEREKGYGTVCSEMRGKYNDKMNPNTEIQEKKSISLLIKHIFVKIFDGKSPSLKRHF